MIIRPKQKLLNKLFYNNLMLIVVIFSIICFWTSINIQNGTKISRVDQNVREGQIYGPIKIDKKPKIYKVKAHFDGMESSSYISGEVLDEEKDTLYEFGKDLWHETGYDDGYYDESDRDMVAYLTFSEKGTYYIQFNTEEKAMSNFSITLEQMKGSYVAHLQAGALVLIFVLILFYFLNMKWVNKKCCAINEALEEASEDD